MGKLIYQKWAFAITLIIIFVIIFTSTTVYLNTNIYSDSKKITHKDLPFAIYALSMIDKFNNMSSNLLEYSHGETEEKNEFFMNLEEYNHYFTQLKELDKIYNTKLPVNRLLRVSEDYINSANRVFLLYNPKNEMWATLEVDKIEHGISKKLELTLEKFRVLSNTNANQNIILLELIDEAGDMLSSLAEYVSGEMDEIEEFENNTKEFYGFIKNLENSKFNKKHIETIKLLHKNLYDRSYTIFDTYNPENKRKALKLIDYMEHNQFKEIESILNILANNSINSKEKIMTSIENSLNTANYISVAMALFTIIISIVILRNLYRNFNHKVKHLIEKQNGLEKEIEKKDKEINKLSSKHNLNSSSTTKEVLFKKAKILIADDIQDNIDLITSYYENKNLEFIEAVNGQEAVELTQKKKPDLILMDLKMPIMNGYEACELIRKDSKINHIPIIAISTSVLDRNILLLEKDFNGYISRPIDFSLLDNELSKYLK